MESKKAITVLNDIMHKLSSIVSPSKKEEAVELSAEAPVVSEEAVDKIQMSAETITEVKEEEVSVELAEEAKEEIAEELSEVVSEEVKEEVVVELEEVEKYVSKESFEAAINEIKSMVTELSSHYANEKVELSEQVEKLSKEPSAEPINHSPEAEVETKEQNLYSKKRGMSTMDRVLNAMNY